MARTVTVNLDGADAAMTDAEVATWVAMELFFEGAGGVVGVSGSRPRPGGSRSPWADGTEDARMRRLLAAGASHAEIATVLGLSVGQVRNRAFTHHRDLSAKSRLAALEAAARVTSASQS